MKIAHYRLLTGNPTQIGLVLKTAFPDIKPVLLEAAIKAVVYRRENEGHVYIYGADRSCYFGFDHRIVIRKQTFEACLISVWCRTDKIADARKYFPVSADWYQGLDDNNFKFGQ